MNSVFSEVFLLHFPIKCKRAKRLKLRSGASKIRNKKSKKKDWKPGSGSWVCNCPYIDLHAFFGGSSFLSLKTSFHVLTWSPFKHPHLDSCLGNPHKCPKIQVSDKADLKTISEIKYLIFFFCLFICDAIYYLQNIQWVIMTYLLIVKWSSRSQTT